MGSEGQRAGLADAEAWVASRCRPLAGEMVGVAEAVGRVLTDAVVAGTDLPPFDRAAWDGYALRAEETAGASAYNPLPVTATRVAAGDELPEAADAVVPVEAVTVIGALLEVVEPVASGTGLERAGSELRYGEVAVGAGRMLRAHGIGLLAALGVEAVTVVRRPRVRVIAVSAGPGGRDADTPMLAALVGRDGGVAEPASRVADLAEALAAPGADLVIVCGGTEPGDGAGSALARVGRARAARGGDPAGRDGLPGHRRRGAGLSAPRPARGLLRRLRAAGRAGRAADGWAERRLALRDAPSCRCGASWSRRSGWPTSSACAWSTAGSSRSGPGRPSGWPRPCGPTGSWWCRPGSEGYPAGTRVEVRLYEASAAG